MLSPVKAIAAGAIVFAIGGAFLIAQPFDQQAANVPGGEAPVPPVAVSGFGSGGACPVEDAVEVAEGLTSYRDGYCNPSWSLDDPRFEGTVTWAVNSDAFPDADGVTVGTVGVSVVNEEGAWRMVPEVMYGTDGTVWPDPSLPSQFVMVGEGGYDGYYAVFTFDRTSPINGTFEGFIVQGDPPPAPEAAGGS